MSSIQSAFNTPIERTHEILERLSNQYTGGETIIMAVSGGTDSTVSADVFARYGPEYGFEPDAITHINTGGGIPQSKLTARILADQHGLEFIEYGYRNERDSLAHRVLEHGWSGGYGGSPVTGGHGLEWANRKHKPMDAVYMLFDGQEIWVSGVRKLESEKRSGNVQDSGIERDKPRRTWVAPIMGWTTAEKIEYLMERGLPVSEAYLVLGFSGECTACSFDDAGLLTDLELLCPELAHALKTLAVWVGMRAVRGDINLEAKRLCWGWEPETESSNKDVDKLAQSDFASRANVGSRGVNIEDATEKDLEETHAQILSENPTAMDMVGCSAESCAEREIPDWVTELPSEQIIDRSDVKTVWNGGFDQVSQRFAHL